MYIDMDTHIYIIVRITGPLHEPKLFNFKLGFMRHTDHKNGTPSVAKRHRLVCDKSAQHSGSVEKALLSTLSKKNTRYGSSWDAAYICVNTEARRILPHTCFHHRNIIIYSCGFLWKGQPGLWKARHLKRQARENPFENASSANDLCPLQTWGPG